MRAADRLLVKVPEHTWGVAQGWFLPDNKNWSNTQFDVVREGAASRPFIKNNTDQADYATTASSWVEQRTYVTNVPDMLRKSVATGTHVTALADAMDAEFAVLKEAAAPRPTSAMRAAKVGDVFRCSGYDVAFSANGGLARLEKAPTAAAAAAAGGDAVGGAVDSEGGGGGRGGGAGGWASADHPLGVFRYETYTNVDFNIYLSDFAARLGPQPAWPGRINNKHNYKPDSPDDLQESNFRKPNITACNCTQRRTLTPVVTAIWVAVDGGVVGGGNGGGGGGGGSSGDNSSGDNGDGGSSSGGVSGGGDSDSGGCEFVIEAAMDAEAHTNAGAPERVVTKVTVSGGGTGKGVIVDWVVVQVNKRATRLPEAAFFSHTPLLEGGGEDGWWLRTLNATLDPHDVVGRKGEKKDGSDWVFGGSPHMRGVQSAHWKGKEGTGNEGVTRMGRGVGMGMGKRWGEI